MSIITAADTLRHEKSSNQVIYAAKFSGDMFFLYEKTKDHGRTSDIKLYLEKNGFTVAVTDVLKRKTISNIGFLDLHSNDSDFYYIHGNRLYLARLENKKIKSESVKISDNPYEFIKKISRTKNGLVLIPDSVRDAKVFVYDAKTRTISSVYFNEHIGRSIQEVKFLDNKIIVVSSDEKELLLVQYEKNKKNDLKESIRQKAHFSGYIKSIDILGQNSKNNILTLSVSIAKKGLLNFLDSEELIISEINLDSSYIKNNKILSQKIIGEGDIAKQFTQCGKEYLTYSFKKESITRRYKGESSPVLEQLNIFPREITVVKSKKSKRNYLIVNFMRSIDKYFNRGFYIKKIDVKCD